MIVDSALGFKLNFVTDGLLIETVTDDVVSFAVIADSEIGCESFETSAGWVEESCTSNDECCIDDGAGCRSRGGGRILGGRSSIETNSMEYTPRFLSIKTKCISRP